MLNGPQARSLVGMPTGDLLQLASQSGDLHEHRFDVSVWNHFLQFPYNNSQSFRKSSCVAMYILQQ